MQFLALALLALTLLLCRRIRIILPFGFLLAGFALLVAWLGQRNPQITLLMPVLSSPLLSAHVSIIMMSYALLAFMMLNGLYALLAGKHGSTQQLQLTLLNRLMLYPAVFLLAAGIFLGAVWANISWGKYWSWDPKETWALITLLIYAIPLHAKSLPALQQPKWFNLYLTLAFLTVLMTYFGVNYFLGGMHSYA
jgi:ABC-type transport system involved in cytochrome c biogenesis permease subunit